MSVKTYKSDFGVFSVISDTDLFNAVIDDETVKTLIPWKDIKCTLVLNTETYTPAPYIAFTNLIPLTVLVQANASELPSFSEPYYEIRSYKIDDSRRIEVDTGYVLGKANFAWGQHLILNDEKIDPLAGYFPYSTFRTSSPRQRPNTTDYISFSTLLTNNEMTMFKIIHVGVLENDPPTFHYGNPIFDEVQDFLSRFFYGLPPIIESNDPYEPGGEIEPGGGTGDFDGTSDPIDFPPLPELSAVDTGFITLFNPTVDQLKNLSSYMWSDLFDIEGWKKIFANPMDAILGLTIVPVAVPNAGTGVVSVGNISTGISMNKATGQYVEIDCGTLNVNEFWGAYLDYDPYTKAEIYLPFIGIHALATDDIMNKPVHVKYHIDLLSGACCAYVKCGNSVLYSFVGQCSCSVPTTSTDWTNIINGALSIAGAIGSMVATNGATAPMSINTIASAAVNSLKPSIEKSGSMGGMGGMLGVQQPYIILTRPRQALPSRLNTYSGYPSFMTKGLGELSGYTKVESIHIENVPATGAELTEIESLLKEGVIL